MPHVDQNLQVASLFIWHAKEQRRQQGSTFLDAAGKTGLSPPVFLTPKMICQVLTT